MLTEKAYRDRCWEGFPTLRQLLENEPPPPRDNPWLPSTAETVLERLSKLRSIATLAAEHQEKVLSLVRDRPDLGGSLEREFEDLRGELDHLRHAWDREIDEAKGLRDAVRRACHEVR